MAVHTMLADLGYIISTYFNIEELRSLCFDLSINLDNVRGETLEVKSKELVGYCRRHGKLHELINRCKDLRPSTDWPNYADIDLDISSNESLTEEIPNNQSIPRDRVSEIYDTPKVETEPSMSIYHSSNFFHGRFRKAFPGVRGIEWIRNPVDAIERLKILFAEPICFGRDRPIWWWRRGDSFIESFRVLTLDTILIDSYEFVLDELAAVNMGQYYQSFIYIKTKEALPTGVSVISPIDWQMENLGYAREVYALFRGIPIRYEEWLDGATIIDGKVVDLDDEAELRTRYLAPYNLIIAPQGSPINDVTFDVRRAELLQGILRNEVTLEDLTDEILRLPRRWWPDN